LVKVKIRVKQSKNKKKTTYGRKESRSIWKFYRKKVQETSFRQNSSPTGQLWTNNNQTSIEALSTADIRKETYQRRRNRRNKNPRKEK
jgi:hypothetical protein